MIFDKIIWNGSIIIAMSICITHIRNEIIRYVITIHSFPIHIAMSLSLSLEVNRDKWDVHSSLIISSWWCHQMETLSALLALCAGNSPITRSFDVFFDLRLNKRFSKQSWGWWFQTPLCLLWPQCNASRHFDSHLMDFSQKSRLIFIKSISESIA